MRNLNATMINTPRALMDKVDSMQKQMSSVSREMEILRKNQTEMLEIKSAVTEMKNASDGLISRLATAEGGVAELQDISIESTKTKKQRERRLEKPEYPGTEEQIQKIPHLRNENSRRRRKRERDKRNV